MKFASLYLLLLFILTGILPDTTPRRPRTVRLSRSASQPSFKQSLVDEDVKLAARAALGNSERVAIVPLAATDGVDAADALAFTMNLAHDLHYVEEFLPADMTTVVWHDEKKMGVRADQINAMAKELEAQLVIAGTLAEEGDDYHLQLIAYDVSDNVPRVVAKSDTNGPVTDVLAIGDRGLLSLLKHRGMVLSDEAQSQITHVATTNPTALRESTQGFQLLFRAMTSAGQADAPDTEELSKKALEHADRALEADSEFAMAYLLKASALENLSRPADVKTTLEAAKAKLNNADRLTRLELLGDYERFVKGKEGQAFAIEYYDEMLQVDPGHLRALLSLVECFAAEEGRPTKGDLEEAATYAARLLAAHPGSPISKLFEP